MANHEKELIEEFYRIKDLGWIETKRYGDQCLGNTFEDLLGKKEDNSQKPDFYDIELKSHRTVTRSLMTLFSKAPSYPRGVNTYLRKTYGVSEDTYKMKVLNTTLTGGSENSHRGGHSFRAVVNYEDKRVYLQIKDLTTKEIVENEIYWSFADLKRVLDKKLKKIAILDGEEKSENGKRYVKYTEMKLFTGLTFEKFLKSIEKGELYIDIRLGVYLTGKNIGKTHDHGTAFRIKIDDLLKEGRYDIY